VGIRSSLRGIYHKVMLARYSCDDIIVGDGVGGINGEYSLESDVQSLNEIEDDRNRKQREKEAEKGVEIS